MKFGVFSVSMPEYGIEESVRLLKELGYDGVEWRVAEMPEKEPENVPFALRYWACNKSTLELRSIEAEAAKAKALCDEAGLEIFGLTTYLATNELEPLARVFHAPAASAAVRCGWASCPTTRPRRTPPTPCCSPACART